MRVAGGGPPGEEAPQDLLRALYPTVRRWATAFTEDGDTAEDVTQETLLRVWLRADSFRGTCRFRSWVYAVTRNTARDLQRKESRERRVWSRQEPAPPVDPRPRLAARARLDRTLRILERLPRDQRRAMEMATAGFTSFEAAERMGVRPGTVRARVSRARATLLETAGVAG